MKSNLYFKHDLYALDDTKLRRLVLKHGAIGYATFFETVAKLMKEETHKCVVSFLISDIAYALHEDESKIASALEYAIDCNLFVKIEDCIESERVNRSCYEFSAYSHMQSEKARKRWENKSTPAASDGNATAMPRHNNGNTAGMPIKEIKKEIEIENKNKLSNDNFCSTLFENSDEADEKDPVFITISLVSGKEHPIHESSVKMWETAYPAVDVRAELQRMKSWAISNPTLRKTAKGIMRFCNNWLSKEQDKSGKGIGTERNDFYGGKYIKGTSIEMPITASGADRSQYKSTDRLEDIL